VATIRYVGPVERLDAPERLFRPADGRAVSEQPVGRVVVGRWGEDPAEEVVLCRIDPERTELHCHGGDAAVERILQDLAARGVEVCRTAWSVSESPSLLELECQQATTRATTLRTADILWQQVHLLPAELESLPGLTASERLGRIDRLLSWGTFGVHLWQPWRVVLFGRPNVGKSSLMNVLLGFARAIVFDQPGTTRDRVTAQTAWSGWPVELSDTAGLRQDADELETAGMERTIRGVQEADLRVLVIDSSEPLAPEVVELMTRWPDAVIVAHKWDLVDSGRVIVPPDAVAVSSRSGFGVAELADRIVARLVPVVPPPETPLPVTDRQCRLLQEWREQLTAGGDESPEQWVARLCRGV
jgi:tRNA modification GTPase